MTTNIIKIGAMPGRLNDFALSQDTTIEEALQVAELSAEGFEVKLDSVSVNDLSQTIGETNVLLLTKKVKGNNHITKVGSMPGRLNDYTFEEGTTVREALEIAELSPEGFDVKLDGDAVSDLDTSIDGVNVLILTKKVKGNNHITKVGSMPGRLNDYTFEEGTSIRQALEIAELSPEGFDVKLDGNSTSDLDTSIDGVNVILLTKKVKGN